MKHLAGAALCLVACGRELHHTVDAPPADMLADTSIPNNGEPPADAVKLTITRLGVGVPGISVVFQGTDSALIEAGATDEMGRVWAKMPNGGFVTAIEHVSGIDELTTFATVVAGDALRLEFSPPGTGNDPVFTVNVPLDASSDGYTVQTSCGYGAADAAGVGELSLTNCASTADIVVLSMFDGFPTGRALYAPAVVLPTSGPLQITGTYENLVASQLTYTNVPPQVQAINGYQAVSATARAFEVSDFASPVAGSATVALNVPPTTGIVLSVSTMYPATGEVGQQILYDWATAKSFTTNLATALMPAYLTAPIYDPASHQVTWTERAGGAAPDLVRAGLQIYRDDIPTGRAWRWRLAAARGSAPSLTFPTLPPSGGFDFNPTMSDSVGIDELTELQLPGGLAPWRTTVFGPVSHAIAGATGRIAMQTLYAEQL